MLTDPSLDTWNFNKEVNVDFSVAVLISMQLMSLRPLIDSFIQLKQVQLGLIGPPLCHIAGNSAAIAELISSDNDFPFGKISFLFLIIYLLIS